jgi:uncharacterized alpha-E superfamily protein
MLQAFETGSVLESQGFEALVALFDSTITFHAHYQQRRDAVALLDLLLLDRENPRSLAWVLDTLRSRLKKLEHGDPAFALNLCTALPDPTTWDLAAFSQPDADGAHTRLMAVLKACDASAKALSDALSQRHFSHADRDNRSLLT